MNRKEITAQRLKKAMERKNMKARDLVELSGVAKASISQYLHGTYAPSEAAAKKMAKPLEVSHLWLLGYGVAMDQKPLEAAPATGTEDEDKEFILYKLFETLIETREFCCDLDGLELVNDGDTVLAHFNNGHTTRINVAYDSGIAMVSDVIKALRR